MGPNTTPSNVTAGREFCTSSHIGKVGVAIGRFLEPRSAMHPDPRAVAEDRNERSRGGLDFDLL